MEARRQRAEEARRAAEADIAALRQRLAVAEGAVRAREREVEKAVRGAQADDAGLVAKVRAGRLLGGIVGTIILTFTNVIDRQSSMLQG